MMLTVLYDKPAQARMPSPEPGDVDATHQALAELIEGLIAADSTTFASRFAALLALMRLHIAEEGGLMRASRYPGIAEHEGEHHRVLGELVQLNLSLKRGRVALARAYVKEGLAPWFDLHMATMDAALAAHLARAA
ncbi:hemerythrin family protein [Thiobacillus sp.]|uniref:bacteriohemerythrin n=1 Tax=Thiobacillus sp. TaxID=924 RepID=UPI0011DC014B|nr:hemerythrin family protein [Thiobacillus sp.]TXH74896.1 MAG: hemerythrin [Thiobacillus sp.]